MTATKWEEHFKLLSAEFPPLSKDGAPFPILSQALDDGIKQMLADYIAAGGPSVNKRFVEDLLSDCVARISNCLTLREKAHDVEIRAINDAVSYQVQTATLAGSREIARLLQPLQSRMSANATSAKVAETEVTFQGDEVVWEVIKDEQDKMFAAQERALDILQTKASTPGNGSNYVERFTLLKELFDLCVKEAYGRCLACASALKIIYGIDVPVPNTGTTGFLNRLALWAQRASDLLDSELGRRYTGEVCFAISGEDDVLKATELLEKTKYQSAVGTNVISFTIKNEHFDRFKMEAPLLRSVRLHVKPKADTAKTAIWSAVLQAPDSDLSSGDENFPCTLTSSFADSGKDTIFGVHNLKPQGDWSLRLPDRAITGEATSVVELPNIFVSMRISYRRA